MDCDGYTDAGVTEVDCDAPSVAHELFRIWTATFETGESAIGGVARISRHRPSRRGFPPRAFTTRCPCPTMQFPRARGFHGTAGCACQARHHHGVPDPDCDTSRRARWS